MSLSTNGFCQGLCGDEMTSLDPSTPCRRNLLAIDAVAVADHIGRRGVDREGVHDQLGGPVRGGRVGDVNVNDPTAVVGEDDKDEQETEVAPGTVKKSTETMSVTWLARNVCQDWEAGGCRLP